MKIKVTITDGGIEKTFSLDEEKPEDPNDAVNPILAIAKKYHLDLLSALMITLLAGKNPLKIYASMFSGAFGTPRRIWNLLNSTCILLGIGLAVTPAFRMKFWNCGAEGQVLMGA
ncbi:MAG: ABC transporter permease, partial [Aeriscardovia sp.]|nr:ABC transporter permease [Aeriscardovia sp.]